jgi:hypothetical protein
MTDRCNICDLPDGQHKSSCSRRGRGNVTAPLSVLPKTPPPSFTCAQRGMVSHNPNDVREGYCGNCHDWSGGR